MNKADFFNDNISEKGETEEPLFPDDDVIYKWTTQDEIDDGMQIRAQREGKAQVITRTALAALMHLVDEQIEKIIKDNPGRADDWMFTEIEIEGLELWVGMNDEGNYTVMLPSDY